MHVKPNWLQTLLTGQTAKTCNKKWCSDWNVHAVYYTVLLCNFALQELQCVISMTHTQTHRPAAFSEGPRPADSLISSSLQTEQKGMEIFHLLAESVVEPLWLFSCCVCSLQLLIFAIFLYRTFYIFKTVFSSLSFFNETASSLFATYFESQLAHVTFLHLIPGFQLLWQ